MATRASEEIRATVERLQEARSKQVEAALRQARIDASESVRTLTESSRRDMR
jgi:hypothetical protein